MNKAVLVVLGLVLCVSEQLLSTKCPLSWFVIQGKVVDRQDNPIQGVRISSFYYDDAYESIGGSITNECISDENGQFKCNSHFGTAILENDRIVSCQGRYPTELELIFHKEKHLLTRKIIPLTKANKKFSALEVGNIKMISIHPRKCDGENE